MAEAVLFNIASSLLRTLSSPAKDQFSLLWNFKRDLERLQNTISTIRDVLLDAERKQAADAAVRSWFVRLKDVLYRADDLFDEITARTLQKKVNKTSKEVRIFFSKSNQPVSSFRITHKVKELRRFLDDISKDMYQFGFSVQKIESQPPIARQSHHHVQEHEILGREEEKKKILEMLFAESSSVERVSVVTIVGIGGMGKTALAQLLYNDSKVVEHFTVRLWACVNYFTDLDVVLGKILASGNSDRHNDLQRGQLVRMLIDRISREKFLLVVDDVWDYGRENWIELKRLLDHGAEGSKILVTTRHDIVATNLGTRQPSLRLGGISDTDALALFFQMALDPSEPKPNHGMKMLGSQIVRKCGNVPLAIRCVGSYLYHKDREEWLSISNKEFARVIPENENSIKEVLMISYRDLPSMLKHCFAYCSIFPKGHVFCKDSLICLWMAQGFIYHQSPPMEASLEDIGDKHTSSLIERCFFQNVTKDDLGKVETFKMHDLLHDLAVDVARNECLLIDSVEQKHLEGITLRHAAYACEVGFSNGDELQQKNLRTLLIHGRKAFDTVGLDRLIQSLRRVRTLDLSYLKMETLPDSVGDLVHLRYLDLSENGALTRLPSSICMLQLLQTLNLSNCSQLLSLPNDIQKLVSLRHLFLKGCLQLTHMPVGLQEMTSLVTLDTFIVKNNIEELRYLGKLDNLHGRLNILLPRDSWETYIGNCNKLGAKESYILLEKHKLQHLQLNWAHVSHTGDEEPMDEKYIFVDYWLQLLRPSNSLISLEMSDYWGPRFPIWVSLLDNLVSISITYCLSCDQLPLFSKLALLKHLKIHYIPLVKYMEDDAFSNENQSFFPSLEMLEINCMHKLEGWWGARNSNHHLISAQSATTNPSEDFILTPQFSRVSAVSVSHCPKLARLPLSPVAEKVSFINVSQELLTQFTVINAPEASCSTSTSSYLNESWGPKLKHVYMCYIRNLVSLPEGWMMHTSTLRSLEISDCYNLEYLSPKFLRHHTALESLIIHKCPKLDLMKDKEYAEVICTKLPRLATIGLEFHGSAYDAYFMSGLHLLVSLKELKICGYKSNNYANQILCTAPPELKSLTISSMNNVSDYIGILQQLSVIEHLEIDHCSLDGPDLDAIPWNALKRLRTLYLSCNLKMESLPERCCQHVPLLQHLKLYGCFELKSLPSWVSRLQSLEISGCPLLKEYEKTTGERWHEIQHIPNVSF